ncbi:MAG: hypothetical protein VB036_11440, partial [Propionicimonas sp.]|nr:hypothetical protein [Propionicimonas sp.]
MTDFTLRHLGPSATNTSEMLARLGYGSLAELTDAAIPAQLRDTAPLDLPAARSEAEVQARLAD